MQLRKLLRVALPTIILIIVVSVSFKYNSVKATENGTETTYFMLTDHLGSTDVVLDDQGSVVERADHMPFGNDRLRITEVDAPETDYKFTGKELDDETGLMYYSARYYDSNIGRFISFDPLLLNEGSKPLASVLTNPQSLNPYTYVTNNPIIMVDESGEYGDDVHYTLTYYLSLKAGLDSTTTGRIAWFNDRTDTSPETAPVNSDNVSNGTTEYYHFASRDDAISRLENAISAKDTDAFGTALHTYQDTYSHGGITMLQHAWLTKAEEWEIKEGTDPDKTVNDVSRATMMAFKSFQYIRAFQKNELGITDENDIAAFDSETSDIWVNISSDVRDFLGTEDKAETIIQKEVDKDEED